MHVQTIADPCSNKDIVGSGPNRQQCYTFTILYVLVNNLKSTSKYVERNETKHIKHIKTPSHLAVAHPKRKTGSNRNHASPQVPHPVLRPPATAPGGPGPAGSPGSRAFSEAWRIIGRIWEIWDLYLLNCAHCFHCFWIWSKLSRCFSFWWCVLAWTV